VPSRPSPRPAGTLLPMCPLIDPLTRLALALEDQPGTHAVLLGSGISRAAGVPTGWELLIDLIRRIAAAEGEADVADPAAWWQRTRGRPPAYSEVVEALAPTAEERRLLLARYFEPTPEDRDLRRKVPTAAHRAIARLMADGRVRVAITTNFDRLLEGALEAEGVQPTVVSGEAGADGLLPLQHVGPLVIKIHGDYRDSPLLNTAEELERYPAAVRELLCRVLTEYGLVVCGWSGDWDAALRDCLLESTRHRFGTFWMVKGVLGEEAKRLVAHRRATVIPIEDADRAWPITENKVQAIRDASAPPPLTFELAIAETKRLVAEPRHRVRLFDLMMSESELLQASLGRSRARSVSDADEWVSQVHHLAAIADRAAVVGAVVGFHGEDGTDNAIVEMLRGIWSRSLLRRDDCDLSRLAPAWATHLICVSVIARGRWPLLRRIMLDTLVPLQNERDVPMVSLYPLYSAFADGPDELLLPSANRGGRNQLAFSDWALARGKETLSSIVRSEGLVEAAWELLDWTTAIVALSLKGHLQLGRYARRGDGAVSEAAMRLVQAQTGSLLGHVMLNEKFVTNAEALGAAQTHMRERTVGLRW
jgi:hypothetical protein